LQVFLSGCCKSRSRCCIYMYVFSVSFQCYRCFIRLLQVFYLDVAYVCNGLQVLSRCFANVFRCILQVFHLNVAYVCNGLHVLSRCFVSVSDICCKCFSCFRTYVTSFSPRCCKSGPTYRSHLLQLWVTSTWSELADGAPSSGRRETECRCGVPRGGARGK
jgi:hypothetical protein